MEDRKLSIAIVGAGVKGVCLLRELSHAHTCVVYEAHCKVGGHWTNPGQVPYTSLQLASRHYRFPDAKTPWRVDMPSADEVQRYIANYLTEKGLNGHIQLQE